MKILLINKVHIGIKNSLLLFWCVYFPFSVLIINAFHWYLLPGSGRKPSPLNETTSMVVETVEKRPGAKSLRRFRGDASKVNVRGPGLKKARCNQTQTFTIDVKDAGKYYQIITGKMQKIAHSWIRCTKWAIARFLFFSTLYSWTVVQFFGLAQRKFNLTELF